MATAITIMAVACSPVSARPPAAPTANEDAETAPVATAATNELEDLLRSAAPELGAVLDEAPRRRLQILVAIPTQGPDGKQSLRRLGFRVDAEYFYPASSVKLCTVLGALEKLDDLRSEGQGRSAVGVRTPIRFIDGEGSSRRAVDTTLRAEIEKALVLSDNEAHNRLFDFVGRDELAERMSRLGIRNARIIQPLGDVSEKPPAIVELRPPRRAPIPIAQRVGFEIPEPLSTEGLTIGNGYIDETGHLVPNPMDFTSKNSIPLRQLQDVLIAITRPDLWDGPPPRITKDRGELLRTLKTVPSDLKHLRVSNARARVLDEMNKPLHQALKSMLPDDNITVFDKGGRAYGFAVENAYAVDETTGRSFFLTATIYANDNDTLNDDRYEYVTIANPFLVRLGEVLGHALLTDPDPAVIIP